MIDNFISSVAPAIIWPFVWAILAGVAVLGTFYLVWDGLQTRADHMRRLYEVGLPADVPLDAFYGVLRAFHGLDKPKPLQAIHAVPCELVATRNDGLRFFLFIPGHMHERVQEWLEQHIDGVVIEDVKPEDDIIRNTKWGEVWDLKVGVKSLDVKDPLSDAKTVMSRFRYMGEGETLACQIILKPSQKVRNPTENKEKYNYTTFDCYVRYAAVGDKPKAMLQDAVGGLKAIDHEGANWKRRLVVSAAEQFRKRSVGLGFPNLLNELELAAIMGWITGSNRTIARKLDPTAMHDQEGLVLGVSNSPRSRGRKIALPFDFLARHGHLLSPPGGGKSTMGINLALEVVKRKDTAVFIFDVSDMAPDFVNSIPKEHADRVVYIDFGDHEYSVGINAFAGRDPERAAGHVVGMFKAIAGDSWGPRLERILRNTAMTTTIQGAPFYTMLPLLTNPALRAEKLKNVPRSRYPFVYEEWKSMDDMAEIAKDSVVNKLQQFVGYEAVRNMLAQPTGIDFGEMIRDSKIVVFRMAEKDIARPAAKAVAQIALELIWNAAQSQPDNDRRNSFVFVDEVHNFGHALLNPDSDRLAEARKYKQAYWMAHQNLGQLDRPFLESMKHNVQNQVVWRLKHIDEAEKIYKMFAPMKAEELIALPEHEVVARLYGSQGLAPTVTFRPLPPPPQTGMMAYIRANTRKNHGMHVDEVRRIVADMHKGDTPKQKPIIGGAENEF